MITTLGVALSVLLAPSAAPKALAVCESMTSIMLCKPMDTLSLPPDPTLGDARTEAMRRYGRLPWICDVNIAGRMEVETCVLPTGPDETPLQALLGR